MTLLLLVSLLVSRLVWVGADVFVCSAGEPCQHGGTCTAGVCHCTLRFTDAACETETQSDYWKGQCAGDTAIKSYSVTDTGNKRHVIGFSCDPDITGIIADADSTWWQPDDTVEIPNINTDAHVSVVRTRGVKDYLVLCPQEGFTMRVDDRTSGASVLIDFREQECMATRIGGSYDDDGAFRSGTRLEQINLPGSFGYLTVVQYAAEPLRASCAPSPVPPPPPLCCAFLTQGIRFRYMCADELHMQGQEMTLYRASEPVLVGGQKTSLRFTTVTAETHQRCEVLEAWSVLYATRPTIAVSGTEAAVPTPVGCNETRTVFTCAI